MPAGGTVKYCSNRLAGKFRKRYLRKQVVSHVALGNLQVQQSPAISMFVEYT